MQKTAAISRQQGGIIYCAPEGEDARILASRARAVASQGRVLIHIAQDDARMATLLALLGFFAPEIELAELPAWDCLPYDRVSPDTSIIARRVAALAQISSWQGDVKPRILLTTVNAALQRVMPREALKTAAFMAREKHRLDLEAFKKFLARNGYIRAETVREAGEFAMRGGIIDLFPPGYPEPLRLDLFGDEIESIKSFDPSTQLTTGSVKEFYLQPVAEFFMDEDSISRFRAGYRAAFGVIREDDPLYEAVSQGRRYNGVEHWLPLFHGALETIFDYAPQADITLDQHAIEARSERLAQVKDFYEARKTLDISGKGKKETIPGAVYRPLPVRALYIEEPWPPGDSLSPFAAPGREEQGVKKGRDFADIRALPDGDVFAELKSHMASLGQRKILVAAYSEGSASRLKGLMEHAGIKPDIVILPLENGFIANDIAVITEQDILGDRLARRTQRKRRADNFLTEVSALSEGDLVVHVDHGIGKFVALETLNAAGKLHDCLRIEYLGGDRLFVPVENIDVLSRFGADEGSVQLDKLGGAGWQARKSRVKKDLMIMAGKLLEVAAARKLRRAAQFESSGDEYIQFAARFPYQETEDQQRAISDVLESLAGEYPMDRLVCGDVGFGKTEVALRAAYVATMGGAQVAVVVPTTLLARQHYRNFKERFSGTNIRVEQLSRLVSAKDATATKKGIADGTVNIIIGTHALFGEGVKFANLGLLIVDEEQRFGVKQKEKLKELKNNVHVLTLTATPIPRTLQMALTGVKEMSLIATPPVDRLAVRTFVLPFDPVVIREAILREHYRGGQSFYVCPRVADLREVEEMLKELVPEVKIISAHGQMSASELEDRMSAFYDRQYDILLATNIIESGLDIPSANTMIIHRADMFGLSQLYQIRGRIGRSKVRAYAYLTHAPGILLNQQAQKRLEVIGTLDTLGAGFQLASHDMDIRGAGNLLGEQQSGHIREVGVELYQQMLEEAVAAAREGTGQQAVLEERWSPQINIGMSVLIPETYVPDLNVRMSLYRRLSDLENKEEIESFAAELIDRFGKIPEEAENLLDIVAIKQLCRKANIAQVEAGPKGVVIGFYKDTPAKPEAVLKWVAEKRGTVRLRPDQKLMAPREWDSVEQRVNGVKSLIRELSALS